MANPKADRYEDRFRLLDARPVDNGYAVDLNGDGEAESFDGPDFNSKQFRSNAVLRWEYRPGSTLFLVWSQGRDHFAGGRGDFNLGSDLRSIFSTETENVFMIKASYWLNP